MLILKNIIFGQYGHLFRISDKNCLIEIADICNVIETRK